MNEIEKLAQMLSEHHVEYVRNFEPDNVFTHGLPQMNQIMVTYDCEPSMSAICQYGSYGAERGLIECYDLLSNEEPEGWFNAYEAYQWMIEHGLEVKQ